MAWETPRGVHGVSKVEFKDVRTVKGQSGTFDTARIVLGRMEGAPTDGYVMATWDTDLLVELYGPAGLLGEAINMACIAHLQAQGFVVTLPIREVGGDS